MKKFFTFSLSAFIALVFTAMSFGQVVVFEDNFDSYTVGGQLACQNPADWTTWNLIPCDANEDAYVSNLYAFSDSNSVAIVQTTELVKPIGDLTSGEYSIAFMVYIPTGKNGVLSIMSWFIAGAMEWAMSVEFNPGGAGLLHAGGFGAATFTYAHDTWQSVEIIVDLDNDIGEFWFDGDSVYTWTWTSGSMGTGGALRLAAGYFWTKYLGEMYVDDFISPVLVVSSVENEEIPIEYALHQNYPNPFNPSTKIKYSVPQSSNIVITVFDILGNEIETLVHEEKPIGTYEITWYSDNLPSGIYFYQIQAGEFMKTKKMILLK